jgi:hypothetical protein
MLTILGTEGPNAGEMHNQTIGLLLLALSMEDILVQPRLSQVIKIIHR